MQTISCDLSLGFYGNEQIITNAWTGPEQTDDQRGG
jgi:hypothetical protein